MEYRERLVAVPIGFIEAINLVGTNTVVRRLKSRDKCKTTQPRIGPPLPLSTRTLICNTLPFLIKL